MEEQVWHSDSTRTSATTTAHRGGREVGRLVWEADHRMHRVLINNVTVAPELRRQGIATELIRDVMRRHEGYGLAPSTFLTAEGRALFDSLLGQTVSCGCLGRYVGRYLRDARLRLEEPDTCDTGSRTCDAKLRRLHVPYSGWRWLCRRCRLDRWTLRGEGGKVQG